MTILRMNPGAATSISGFTSPNNIFLADNVYATASVTRTLSPIIEGSSYAYPLSDSDVLNTCVWTVLYSVGTTIITNKTGTITLYDGSTVLATTPLTFKTISGVSTKMSTSISYKPTLGQLRGNTLRVRVQFGSASTKTSYTASVDGIYADLDYTIPDTTPPMISNVSVAAITSSSAEISWVTNEASDTTVEYGKTTSLGLVDSSAVQLTSHRLTLSLLESDTTYYYQVKSKDSSINTTIDDNGGLKYTFKTLIGFSINNIVVTHNSSTSVTITCDTTQVSDLSIDYGVNSVTEHNEMAVGYGLTHSITLDGLLENTDYLYWMMATTSEYLEQTYTSTLTFSTSMGSAAPVITIVSQSKDTISAVTGMSTCSAIFKSDLALVAWEARADGSGVGSGSLIGSGGSVAANTEVSFDIDNTELIGGDKTYRINVYGQNSAGVWSLYG